jgi:hypothetical protein
LRKPEKETRGQVLAKSAILFHPGICGSDFSRSTSETISPLSRGVSSEKPGAFWGALSGD